MPWPPSYCAPYYILWGRNDEPDYRRHGPDDYTATVWMQRQDANEIRAVLFW